MANVNDILSEFVDVNQMIDEVEKSTVKKFWRPTKPKTTVRILPPLKKNKEALPYFEHRVHWIGNQPYECLNQTMVDKDGNMHNAEPCPICKMVKALYNSKSEDAIALAKQISAKTRYVARIVVRGEEGTKSPVFYELPFKVYDDLKAKIVSKEWGSIVGPLNGRDLDIIKTGEGRFTRYDTSSFKPSETKIYDSSEEIVSMLNEANDMSYNSLISFSDPDSMKSASMENDAVASFFGGVQDNNDTYYAADKANDVAAVVDDVDKNSPIAKVLESGKSNTPEAVQSSSSELDDLLNGLV